MGSIPAGSTKKRRMQFCIRRFLVFFLVNPSSVHNSEAVQQQQRKAEKYGEVASNSMLKGIKNFKKNYNGINVFVDICNVFIYDIDVR